MYEEDKGIFIFGFYAIVSIIVLALRCYYHLKAKENRREVLRRDLEMRRRVVNELIVQLEIIHQQQQQQQ
jgi:outer membrane lipopolysaccharide assembly protein LptE/RlpB